MTKEPTRSAKQKVIKWVRDRNPETLQLKFGCHVDIGGNEPVIVMDVNSDLIGNVVRVWCRQYLNETSFLQRHVGEIKEIIGSDMGLCELLIALNEIELGAYAFNSDGWLYKRRYLLAKYGSCDIQYDMKKNLHSQSPEFYEALLTLIPSE